ncbi:MAG: hypothetical protein RQ729_00330 [Wenzhouxiangellaceae bacterium]|nr:hypothetical protein [Wenzhouxiangellaceae bacterium]
MRLIRHFGALPLGMQALWLFLVWYLAMVAQNFHPEPRLWLNALGMAAIVGTALMLSTAGAAPSARSSAATFWRVLRLYAIPFCVSSFSALVRDRGFVAIFAPDWRENLIALLACAAFAFWLWLCRRIGQAGPTA